MNQMFPIEITSRQSDLVEFTYGEKQYRFTQARTDSENISTMINLTDNYIAYQGKCAGMDLEAFRALEKYLKPPFVSPDKPLSELRPEVVYISGPMTGVKELNKPEFDRIKDEIIASGNIAISPPDIPCDNPGKVWSIFMKADLKEMLRADMLLVLDNWDVSPGAIVEILIAKFLGISVHLEKDKSRLVLSTKSIVRLVKYLIKIKGVEMGILPAK